MRGKLAKQIRKMAANPALSEENVYDQTVVKTIVQPVVDGPDIHTHKIQVTLSRQCQRFYYQFIKDQVKRVRRGMQPRSLLGGTFNVS